MQTSTVGCADAPAAPPPKAMPAAARLCAHAARAAAFSASAAARGVAASSMSSAAEPRSKLSLGAYWAACSRAVPAGAPAASVSGTVRLPFMPAMRSACSAG